MSLGADQCVSGRERVDVKESDVALILVYSVGRQPSRNDLAEDAFFLGDAGADADSGIGGIVILADRN